MSFSLQYHQCSTCFAHLFWMACEMGGICCTPHLTGKCGTRPFLVGPDAGPYPTRARHFPKVPTAPSAFPLLGAPQTPGDQPPKGVIAWMEGPLRLKEISRHRDTLGQIRAPDNTAGRSATQHLERSRPRSVSCLTDRDWWEVNSYTACRVLLEWFVQNNTLDPCIVLV